MKKRMESKRILLAGLFSFIVTLSLAQTESGEFKIMFYNLENLFDIKDDSLTNDEDFTPGGEMHWTYNRLNSKLKNILKVIIAAGGWQMPDVLLFCEIENRFVLDKLANETPLKNTAYKIIHKESPDHRGIDVAMLYNSERFYPISYKYYPLIFKNEVLKTREILCVSGIADGKDTIHILGNHWPSRYSGLLETRELREAAARLLRSLVEQLKTDYKNPKIIIAGDFNENPDDNSIINILGALSYEKTIADSAIYNLSANWVKANNGTLKYQSQWFVFDQILVSGALLNSNDGLHTTPENASIVNLPFLLEEDKKFGGRKPYRTYNGFDYQGGFSDHLPVMLRLSIN